MVRPPQDCENRTTTPVMLRSATEVAPGCQEVDRKPAASSQPRPSAGDPHAPNAVAGQLEGERGRAVEATAADREPRGHRVAVHADLLDAEPGVHADVLRLVPAADLDRSGEGP